MNIINISQYFRHTSSQFSCASVMFSGRFYNSSYVATCHMSVKPTTVMCTHASDISTFPTPESQPIPTNPDLSRLLPTTLTSAFEFLRYMKIYDVSFKISVIHKRSIVIFYI